MVSSFVDHDMVMRYHWGLGVGHTYAHEGDNEGPRNETNSRDEQDQAAESCSGAIRYTVPDVSDIDESDEDEGHPVADVESDSGGSDSESVGSVDNSDIENYDTLDYQN